MRSYSKLEHHRQFITILLLVITISILAVSSLRDSYSYDAFWHLKMGQDWIEKGLSPFQDHYSIAFHGEKIESPAYPFQVLLYGYVSTFGQNLGFKAIVFSASLLTLGLMIIWLRKVNAPVSVTVITLLLLVLLLQQRAMVRPEVFSYSFMIISLLLYEASYRGPAKRIFPLIALTMLVWTNFHSAILGYVIFFGLFVDLGLQQLKNRSSKSTWVTWFCWGLLILLVGIINPSFAHPVVKSVSFSNEWKGIIQEYASPFSGSVDLVTILFFLFASATILLALKMRLIGYFLVSCIFTWSAFSMERMIPPAGIVILCVFSRAVSEFSQKSNLEHKSRTFRTVLTVCQFLLVSLVLLTSVLTARKLVGVNQYLVGKFPNELVQYMKDTDKAGRIFNNDAIGGYLLYQLGDTSRVYIDSRTNILYPFEFNQTYRDALLSPAVLRQEIEKYDIDYIILGHRQEQVDLVHQTDMVTLDYSDLRYSLYSRKNANFPVAGSLWSMPWCWNDRMANKLEHEYLTAQKILPSYSPLTHLTSIAYHYSKATNPHTHLESLASNKNEVWYENNLRFAGYRALENGQPELAVTWMSRLGNVVLKDYLALSLAYLRSNRPDEAESVLSEAIHINWNSPAYNDFRIIQGLLSELSAVRPLKFVDSSYLSELTSSLGEDVIAVSDSPVSVDTFCSPTALESNLVN